jgi:nucleoside 2-deoxyribosyltransferase
MYFELKSRKQRELNGKCPVCGSSATIVDAPPDFQLLMIICGVCGKFRLDVWAKSLLDNLWNDGDSRLYKVSHRLRQISEFAKDKHDDSFFPVYSQQDIEKLLSGPDLSIQEKLNTLLRYLSSISEFPGDRQEIDCAHDYPVFCAKNEQEADFYLRSLYESGFLGSTPLKTQLGTTFSISTKGWIELDRLQRANNNSSNAFVAMWFAPDRRIFFDAMKKAIEDAGYLPIRIDMVEHINHIDDEIISQIRQSKFLVADLSGQRNGVYFEAGFMLGLDRPVIWACEKTEIEKVHFDTRQFNMITYEDSEDLRKRLQFRIEAILGKGPLKKVQSPQ